MARTRRRHYPRVGALPEPKYGRRGNARSKHTEKHTGGHGDLPNRPRRDKK